MAKRATVTPAPGSEWVDVVHPDDVPGYPIGTALYFDDRLVDLHKMYVKVATDAWVLGTAYDEARTWKAVATSMTGTHRVTDAEVRREKFLVMSEGWKVRPCVIG